MENAPVLCEANTVELAGPDANPLGQLRPSQVSIELGTGFVEFRSPAPLRIGGLVKLAPGRIDILAVLSEEPGQGHFTRFLNALERGKETLTFWSMMSDDLKDILKKRGYRLVTLTDPFGQKQQCMRLGPDILESEHETDASVPATDGQRSQGPLSPGAGQGLAVGDVGP